jgi:hypothetical protein
LRASLSIRPQCALLGVARSGVNRSPRPANDNDLALMRRIDELVQAMGLAGISKSTVSKLCKDIDDRVNAFLDRPLAGNWPYLWLDATYLKQRDGGRIVSVPR